MNSQATILLIEDDHASSVIASTMLNREGYNVICVDNGRDGLAVAQADGADIIILDLNLPLLSGQKILEARMQSNSLSQIPLIVTSAHAQTNIIEEAQRLGADYYYIKPLDWVDIVSKIRQILTMKPLSRLG
jgi:DNA-binding response OmpR family regulator